MRRFVRASGEIGKRLEPAVRLFMAAVVLLRLAPGASYAQEATSVTALETDGVVELANGLVRAVFTPDSQGVKQAFYANRNGAWVAVLEAFRPPSPRPPATTELYLDRSTEYGRALDVAQEYRLVVPEMLHAVRIARASADEAVVVLSGGNSTAEIKQTVRLRRGDSSLHVDVAGNLLGEPPRLEYLLSPFAFARTGPPDFSHAPAFKRAAGDVIGDRVFFAPAALVQSDSLFAAVLPDLDQINRYPVYAQDGRPQKHPWIFRVPIDSSRISLPHVLDLDLATGMTSQPVLAYGVMDVLTEHHFHWRHINAGGTFVRTLSGPEIRYGMDLLISAQAAPGSGYQDVGPILWERYGRQHFRKPRPQAMPFAEYARALYPASFSYQGYVVDVIDGDPVMRQRKSDSTDSLHSWQQWEGDTVPMGAQRLAPPFWYHLAYNAAWWNNVGDATGFYYWGEALGDSSLIDKARRVINFTLSAPQNRGLFPSLYNMRDGTWVGSMWEFPHQGYDPDEAKNYWNWVDGDYHTAAASVTAGFLMQVYERWQRDERILEYVRRYGTFLLEHMADDGSVPSWFSPELEARPNMRWNAEGGAHVWVMSELYRATGQAQWLRGAERAADFLLQQVLPLQRWVDFEALYSCAVKAESFFDPRTGQYPRNGMSMSWALEGFLSLFAATGQDRYLDAAEQVADYATFLQAVWAPHFIVTAYPFGGFTSQIGDAEWLDQRDHRFVDPLIRLGLAKGRQDLVERGVAAARSSLALVTMPEHLENDIYPAQTFPYGVGPENIDHEGVPQTPLRSGPSWSEVGGLAAAAHAMRLLGGLFVDVARDLAVGVDGVAVDGYSLRADTLEISVTDLLGSLKVPYGETRALLLRVDGLDAEKIYSVQLGSLASVEAAGARLKRGIPVTLPP